MLRLLVAYLIVLLHQSNLSAQAQLNIGEWQNHLNYRESFYLTQSGDDIIVSTGKSIILIDKKELSHSYFSKIDGLSETKIKQVKYDTNNKQLLVIYESGGFDIVNDESIEYITSIKDNNNIVGSKTINDVHFSSANLCYFATAFGVIEFDLQKTEFRSTTFTPVGVNAITSDKNFIYASMENGVYRIEKDNFNKENFSNWILLASNFGLPATYKAQNIETFNDRVFAVVNEELYSLENNKFNKVNLNVNLTKFKIKWLSAEGKNLVIGLRDNEFSSFTKFIDANFSILDGGANCINRTIYGIEDQYGKIWYADEWRQIRYTNGPNEGCNRLEFDSPYSYESSHIEVGVDKVFFASGGATENYQIDFNRSGIYILNQDQTWTNINEEYNPIIKEKNYLALYSIAPHPKNKDLVYIGSYLNGLVEYNLATKEFRFFGEKEDNGVLKSSLQSIVGAPGQVRISHMKFDESGNLWIANFGAPKPISVFTKEGNWHSFNTSGNTLLTKMTIDAQNNKWFSTIGSGPSVTVFNDNGTPADPSDDKVKSLNASNSILSNAQVNCVEVDLNGDIWVGTAKGPIVFECDPFDKDCIGSQRKVLQDNIPALLLETEEIFSIEVDGANRKWFGTRNGIFVQSSDGETQVMKFNEENSPLLNNKIVDLDYDGNSGLMYISTESGIQIYKTDATEGGKINSQNAYAFPNPVRPEYNGPVAIKGLARDADVRITDINGKLVFKTKANGGQAIWDGNDYSSGSRVDTGVYLVFAASELDPTVKDVVVTKILVVK